MRRPPALLLAGLATALVTLPALASARPADAPGYTSYQPAKLAASAGEPSIGVSWRTGAVFLQAMTETVKGTFGSRGSATWSNVAPTETALLTVDPIGFTDSATGRTFVSQLMLATSLMAYSDDDGKTWTPSQGSGLPAGVDHQTVGGGPYPRESSVGPLTSYPHAVYYCSQSVVAAMCARSDTGGLTFGAGVPMYTLAECTGLHGHVTVAPDGTVYVPNSDCPANPTSELTADSGRPAVAVSTDAGLTWTIRHVPGSSFIADDPTVAVGRDGTVYFAYTDADGHPQVTVSRDRGLSWGRAYDVGASQHIASDVFPSVVAGDGDRAAVAFLGTRTKGDPQDPAFGQNALHSAYTGADYHLYVATTYDRGRSWKTVDVTGSDPVQRGRICLVDCTEAEDRNLLDFMGITVDRQGRVLVGWADGCTGPCVESDIVAQNRHADVGMVTRQSRGPGLFRRPPALTP